MRHRRFFLFWLLIFAPLFAAGGEPSPGKLVAKPVPLISYDTDTGLGLGADLLLYRKAASGKDYLWFSKTEVYITTRGEYRPSIRFDLPRLNLGGLSFRLQGYTGYTVKLFESYYGFGSSDAATDYDTVKNTNYYYRYKKDNPFLHLHLSVPLSKDGSAWSLLGGFKLGWYGFTNSTPADGVARASLLMDSRPSGWDGGWDFNGLLGVRFDNRDFEPNPHHGTLNELTLEYGARWKDGSYPYGRVSFLHTFYFEPLLDYERLVFCERIIADQLFGQVPFYAAENFGGVSPVEGPGGTFILRGMPRYRLNHWFKMAFSPEIRWRALDFGPLFGDIWHLEVILFADVGAFAPGLDYLNISDLTWSYGGHLRVLWDEDFIIAVAYGFWQSEFGLYFGFEQKF